jgi:flagellar hook-length control protein FliK
LGKTSGGSHDQLLCPLDGPAAEHAGVWPIVFVEHAGLTGRDSFFRRKQLDENLICLAAQQTCTGCPRGAHAHGHIDALCRDMIQWTVTNPVDLAQGNTTRRQSLSRPHDDALAIGINPHDVKRRASRNAQTLALADGVADHALMATQHAAIKMQNLAGFRSTRAQFLDQFLIASGWHKTDVLAVRLVRDLKAVLVGQRPRLGLALQVSQREAQQIQLLLRRGIKEIALVAIRVGSAKEYAVAIGADPALNIMTGSQHIRTEFARGCQQIAEFHAAVAFYARNGRLARDIAVDEAVNHLLPEAGFVIQHVMRNADAIGHRLGVVDVLSGATRALAVDGGTVVVELQRHAHDIVTLLLEQCGDHRRIHATRHGNNHAGLLRRLRDIECIQHDGCSIAVFWRSRKGLPDPGRFCRLRQSLPDQRYWWKSKALNLMRFYLALFLQACEYSQESPAFMSTSTLIKDLLSPGPARAPASLRKPEPKTDSQDFGRVLEDSRLKTELRDKPVKREAEKADAPGQERKATRREDDKAVSDKPEAKGRPETKGRPEPAARAAEDKSEIPAETIAANDAQHTRQGNADAAKTEALGDKPKSSKSDDKPADVAATNDQTVSAAVFVLAPKSVSTPETKLTADLLANFAAETTKPEASAATAIVATLDQVAEAANPTDTAASTTSPSPVIAAPVPAAPSQAVEALTAKAYQPLQAINGEKVAETPSSPTNPLTAPDVSKGKYESPDRAESPEDKATASPRSEIPQATHQKSSVAAKELSSVIERLAEPNTPATGQPNAQTTALLTTAADALASAKPQDPAHALARADAPVPLQAIAVEIGMRAMRGSKEFSIRLDPEDLGRIDIKLEISEAGQVQAKLVVERVETLQLLQRDAKTLERAFDQAGLKTNPDGLQFSLRDPGQQGRQSGQQQGQPVFGTKDKDSAMIDEIALRPVIYRTAATGGLDIRI